MGGGWSDSGGLLRSGALDAAQGLAHGFTRARRPGPHGDQRLDLGRAASPEDWAWAAAACGLPGAGVARVDQVHGGRVLEVDGAGVAGPADGLWTARPGLLLAVRMADCVPVLVEADGAVGAAHAGWRGVAAGVVPALVAALRAAGHTPRVAAVGPCISVDRYEVGEEVVDGIRAAGVPEAAFVRRGAAGGRPHVDLRAAVEVQLRAAGLPVVDVCAACTATDPGLWSHRRDGAARGSLAGLIGRRAP